MLTEFCEELWNAPVYHFALHGKDGIVFALTSMWRSGHKQLSEIVATHSIECFFDGF